MPSRNHRCIIISPHHFEGDEVAKDAQHDRLNSEDHQKR
ncbi:Uncharacterised protein [Vibrio cholerae]|nr:Uncharacterised protein [Vibrio cholerae]